MQKRPIFSLSLVASAALLANRFATIGGAYPAAGAAAFGVTDTDAAPGADVAVDIIGTSKITAAAAFAAGADLKTDATGRALAQGGAGTILATSLEAATAEGQVVEVLLKLT